MIGSSVNPALGRIDYSPITQGAQSAAQSIQAGGQAYGQMFANLGKQIGGGIEQYQKNKQERDAFETRALSNIGEYIEFNNRFKANPSVFGNTNPVSQKTLDELAAKKIPNLPIGQLKALVDQTEKLLQQPRAVESFIQQQALTDAANQQRNARIEAAYDAPQANAPFYLGRPMQPDTPEARTKRLVKAGASFPEAIAMAKAPSDIRKTEAEIFALTNKQPPLPSYQQDRLKTEVKAFTTTKGRPPTEIEMAGIYRSIDEGRIPDPFSADVSKILMTRFSAAQNAVQSIKSIDDQIAMIDKGDINVGFTGDVQQGIDKLKALFGNKQAAERVTNTEILESVLGKDLLDAINALGLTTQAYNTPAEMKNLRTAFTGGTEMSPAAIRQLAVFRRGVIQTLVNRYNEEVDLGMYNRLGKSFGTEIKKVTLPIVPIVIKSITPQK
jgi:hypothetical protein